MSSDFKRHLLGPCIVFLSLFLGEVGIRLYHFPVILAIPYAVLALTAFYWSGLRGALLSALLISLYPPLLRYSHYGLFGSIVIALGAFMIAAPSGILKRALKEQVAAAERNRHAMELINAANGNLGKLREVHLDSVKLIDAWKSLSDAAKFEVVNSIRGNLGHVLTVWEGWHALFQEREIVKWENLKQKLRGGDG